MHRLRYTRRQKLKSVYRPVSHYLCGAREGFFSRGSPRIDTRILKISIKNFKAFKIVQKRIETSGDISVL